MLLNDYADQSTLRGALHPLFSLLAVVCFMLAVTLPAFGEVYTWADADGIVHYSSVPPEKSKSKVKRMQSRELAVSQGKAPAPTQNAALRSEAQATQELAGKVEELQRQVDVERQARQTADAQNLATQAAYAQTLANQQAARNAAYIPGIPTVSGILVLPPFHQSHENPCRSDGVDGMMHCPQRNAAADHHKFEESIEQTKLKLGVYR